MDKPEIRNAYEKRRGFLRRGEKGQLEQIANILNGLKLAKVQEFYALQWVDLKVAYNAKNIVKEDIQKDPFAFIADLNSDGTLDNRTGKIDKNSDAGRIAPLALLNTYFDQGNWKNEDTNEAPKKMLIDGEDTKQIILQFAALLKVAGVTNVDSVIKEWKVAELGAALSQHPEWKAIYLKQLEDLTYYRGYNLKDIVKKDRFVEISKNKNQALIAPEKFLNQLDAENQKLLVAFLEWLDPEDKKDIEAMNQEQKTSVMRAIMDGLDKVPNALLWIVGLGVTTEQKATTREQLRKTATWKLAWLGKKWDPDAQPRLVLNFPTPKNLTENTYDDNGNPISWPEKWANQQIKIWVSLPLINYTRSWNLNDKEVQSASIADSNVAYTQLYTRAWAAFDLFYATKEGKEFSLDGQGSLNPQNDPYLKKLSGSLMAEFGVWIKKEYLGAIEDQSEYKAQFFTEWLLKWVSGLENLTLDSFKAKLLENIAAMKNPPKETKKLSNWAKYIKENPAEVDLFVTQLTAYLDQNWVFKDIADNKENDQIGEHLTKMVEAKVRWIINQAEFERKQTYDNKVKLSRAWIFGRIGWEMWFGGSGKRIQAGFGFETSLAAFKVLYAPDAERLKWMDEDLKNGTGTISMDANRLKWLESHQDLVDRLTKQINAKEQWLEIKVLETGVIEFSSRKWDVAEILNMYYKPDVERSQVKYKDGKLLVWDVSVLQYVNRQYFNTEAHYLMLDGKGTNGLTKIEKWNPVNVDKDIRKLDLEAWTEAAAQRKLADSFIDAYKKNNKVTVVPTEIRKRAEKTAKDIIPAIITINEQWDYIVNSETYFPKRTKWEILSHVKLKFSKVDWTMSVVESSEPTTTGIKIEYTEWPSMKKFENTWEGNIVDIVDYESITNLFDMSKTNWFDFGALIGKDISNVKTGLSLHYQKARVALANAIQWKDIWKSLTTTHDEMSNMINKWYTIKWLKKDDPNRMIIDGALNTIKRYIDEGATDQNMLSGALYGLGTFMIHMARDSHNALQANNRKFQNSTYVKETLATPDARMKKIIDRKVGGYTEERKPNYEKALKTMWVSDKYFDKERAEAMKQFTTADKKTWDVNDATNFIGFSAMRYNTATVAPVLLWQGNVAAYPGGEECISQITDDSKIDQIIGMLEKTPSALGLLPSVKEYFNGEMDSSWNLIKDRVTKDHVIQALRNSFKDPKNPIPVKIYNLAWEEVAELTIGATAQFLMYWHCMNESRWLNIGNIWIRVKGKGFDWEGELQKTEGKWIGADHWAVYGTNSIDQKQINVSGSATWSDTQNGNRVTLPGRVLGWRRSTLPW
jgi:hypothetical protein